MCECESLIWPVLIRVIATCCFLLNLELVARSWKLLMDLQSGLALYFFHVNMPRTVSIMILCLWVFADSQRCVKYSTINMYADLLWYTKPNENMILYIIVYIIIFCISTLWYTNIFYTIIKTVYYTHTVYILCSI